jgi:hypothetical protein
LRRHVLSLVRGIFPLPALDLAAPRWSWERERAGGFELSAIAWDEPATLIDLDGKAPVIGTIRDCAMHFAIFRPAAKAQARILLTRPVHREGRKTRTWLLEPEEIEALAQRLESAG